MSDPVDDVDIHLSDLFTWLVGVVGQAILWASLASAGFAVLGAVIAPGVMFWIAAAVAGPIVFGWRLAGAQAPMPHDVRADVETERKAGR